MTEVAKEYDELDCVQCGKTFRLYVGQKEDFVQKGLEQPKRCKTCRDQNKFKAWARNEIKLEVERQLAELNK